MVGSIAGYEGFFQVWYIKNMKFKLFAIVFCLFLVNNVFAQNYGGDIVKGSASLVITHLDQVPFELRSIITTVPLDTSILVTRWGDESGVRYFAFLERGGVRVSVGDTMTRGSYHYALGVLYEAEKNIPVVTKLLNKPRPHHRINIWIQHIEDAFANYTQRGGGLSEFGDNIIIRPNLSRVHMRSFVSHELVHWVNRTCVIDPFCEITSQIIQSRFDENYDPPSRLALLKKVTLPDGSISPKYFNTELQKYLTGKSIPSFGGGDVLDAHYAFGSLLSDEMRANLILQGQSPDQSIAKVQSMIDKIHKVGSLDEIAKELGFKKGFTSLETALRERFIDTKGVPATQSALQGLFIDTKGVPAIPSAASGIIKVAGVATKVLGVVSFVMGAHDFIVEDNSEYALTKYAEIMKQYAVLERPSVLRVFWGRLIQVGVTIGVNIGADDIARMLHDGITKESIDDIIKKELRRGLALVMDKHSELLTDFKKTEPDDYARFIDGLRDIGVRTAANPLVSELNPAPVNWWQRTVPSSAPTRSFEGRMGRMGP